ncbi:MAG TPA: hypothetical protein VFR07_01245 [Mycobacteriales bacterium]|jgi:hypothetical protein|nr:hypothetical protein [Mycobacteriales bacterium]
MEPCADLSNTQLADQIVAWAGRIAAGLAQQLALIAEFDRREAWAGPGAAQLRALAAVAHGSRLGRGA